MSRNEVIVTCYVCRRELCVSTVADGKGENTYHAWLICDACLQDAATTPESSVDPALAADTAGKFGERLRDAVAEVAADHVEGKVWRIDDLSEDQVADVVAGLPDLLKSLAEKPLDGVAGMAGIPAPAASPGADVMAAFLLKPVLGPMESAVHAFEVTGIIIGLLTGLHPLVIICLKHLAHDELGAAIADAVEQILSPAGSATAAMSPTAAAHPRPGAGETTARRGLSPGASPREAGATASPRSSADSYAFSRDPAASQRLKLPTRPASREGTGRVKHEAHGKPSPAGEKGHQDGAALFGKQDATNTIDHTDSSSVATVSTEAASSMTHLA